MKNIGQCKLCLVEGLELQKSHAVPAGVFRILRDDGAKNPNFWEISEEKAFQTSKQPTAPLFCRICENDRLSSKGENWVLANCLRKDGSFRLASTLRARIPDVAEPGNPTKVYWAANIPEINRSALSYFAASVFWRASIYGWSKDGSIPVKLGPFQEAFRKYLMGEAEFPEHCVLTVAVREGKDIDRLTYFPIGERKGNVHVYKFPMPGLGLSLTVSKNIPAKLQTACFVHFPGNPIIVTSLIDGWLMQEAGQLWQKHLSRQKKSA